MSENMSELRPVILAFLAGRSPAAYRAAVITQRINKSGLLDQEARVEDVERELRVMANERFKWIDLAVDPTTQELVWFATESGVRRWTLDGSMYVGG